MPESEQKPFPGIVQLHSNVTGVSSEGEDGGKDGVVAKYTSRGKDAGEGEQRSPAKGPMRRVKTRKHQPHKKCLLFFKTKIGKEVKEKCVQKDRIIKILKPHVNEDAHTSKNHKHVRHVPAKFV